ncbi:MAG: Asp-tRNA(Asn)/Glu-tRNA(Gln) amidotransferase subunit GatC [Candidatus Krumholzibacteria bacterium]|nr:Asp-tRNA(Asn)/Glu-tRNA(Gln) amidotransferase subunit GatC [Candidatus Krumholzibacteria bacterium]
MKIDARTITHLEKLARIELTAQERERLSEQLDRIVGYVEQLQEVDTTDVSPTSAVTHQAHTQLRADEPRKGLERDAILSQAPDAKDGYFRVPKVIER